MLRIVGEKAHLVFLLDLFTVDFVIVPVLDLALPIAIEHHIAARTSLISILLLITNIAIVDTHGLLNFVSLIFLLFLDNFIKHLSNLGEIFDHLNWSQIFAVFSNVWISPMVQQKLDNIIFVNFSGLF